MKSKIIAGMMLIAALVFITAALYSGETKNDETGWINVKITDMNTGKDMISIRLPISVLNLINEYDHESKIGISTGCKIDFTKLIELMKESDNQFLIKVEDKNEHKLIKIWLD
jgi:hypothetical protein